MCWVYPLVKHGWLEHHPSIDEFPMKTSIGAGFHEQTEITNQPLDFVIFEVVIRKKKEKKKHGGLHCFGFLLGKFVVSFLWQTDPGLARV